MLFRVDIDAGGWCAARWYARRAGEAGGEVVWWMYVDEEG